MEKRTSSSSETNERTAPCPPQNGQTGLFGTFNRAIGSIRHLINTRIELLTVELREEKSRAISLIFISFGSLFFAFLFFMAATAATAIYLKDNAFAVLLGFSAFYLIGAVGLILMLKSRLKAPMFPETIAQLKKDREELLSRKS
jgi:uncharacterized membrane protein YqjE